MLSFDKLCNQSKFFARLTGVKLEQFHEIVRKVHPRWERLQKQKKVSGRPSKIKTLADGILLVSIYYRFYVSFQFLGMLFDLDESNICRHIQRLEPMLADVIKISKNRELSQSDLETIRLNGNSDSEAQEKSETILFWEEETSYDEIRNHDRHKRKNPKYFKMLWWSNT